MSTLYILLACFLLLNICAGLARIMIGPTNVDRMLAIQLLCTCGIGTLLLLSKAFSSIELLDIACVFALLATLAILTFIRRAWQEEPELRKSDDPL